MKDLDASISRTSASALARLLCPQTDRECAPAEELGAALEYVLDRPPAELLPNLPATAGTVQGLLQAEAPRLDLLLALKD